MSTNWKNANESDKILREALSMLYGNDGKIFQLLFDVSEPRLTSPADIIKQEMGVLSMGEQLLVRIGLDIWDGGSGGIYFNELYQKLDDKNFQKMLLVLLFLRSK